MKNTVIEMKNFFKRHISKSGTVKGSVNLKVGQ